MLRFPQGTGVQVVSINARGDQRSAPFSKASRSAQLSHLEPTEDPVAVEFLFKGAGLA